jgi:hypothetical protein
MRGQRISLTTIPQSFHGQWEVISCRDPDGTTGAPDEVWTIYPDSIESPDFNLAVASVTGDVEPHQDLHLISFSNNGLQFTFLRSGNHEDKLLVVWYSSGRELRRFLLK